MSAAVAPAEARPALPYNAALYRDDGPLADALGRGLGRAGLIPVPAMALLLAGAGAILALAAFAGRDASVGLAGAAVAWLVVTIGVTSHHWPKPSFHWAVPPLVRLGEYAALAWIAALADAVPAAFALIAALTYRHYDLVYRFRHRAEVPPAWLNALALGWEGRVILAWVLLALGALPVAMYVWAGLLGAVSVAETVMAWRRFESGRGAAGEFDEIEGEGE